MPKFHRRVLSTIFRRDKVEPAPQNFDVSLMPRAFEMHTESDFTYAGASVKESAFPKEQRNRILGWRLNANIPGSIEYHAKHPFQEPIWAPPFVLYSVAPTGGWQDVIKRYHEKQPLPLEVREFLESNRNGCTDETRAWISRYNRNAKDVP